MANFRSLSGSGAASGCRAGPPSTLHKLGAAAVLGAALLMVSLPPAGAETAAFRATPTSGPPGTRIALSSVTPCTLPAGVTGQPFVRASLTRGSTVITATTIPLNSSGSWTGALTVGSQAALGTDTIEAFCFANPQAEGVLLAYSPRTFTVTAPGGLPNTGFDGRVASGTAALLILAGSGLLLAARRRSTTGPTS